MEVVCFPRNNDPTTEPTIIFVKESDARDFPGPASATDVTGTWGIPTGSNATNYPITYLEASNVGEVNTTFGMTWDLDNQRLITGSFMRAFAPMGTNSSSNGFAEATLYQIPVDVEGSEAGTPSVWLDLETLFGDDFAGTYIQDNIFPGPRVYGRTSLNPQLIGYTGLGSIKAAYDNSELYVVNLNTREVLVIPIGADGAAPTMASEIKRFPLPDTECSGNWPDGRPYYAALGLGVHPESGRVYATMTCTGPTLADVTGIVYSFDPSDATPAASDFRKELEIPLDIRRPASNPNVSRFYDMIDHEWEEVTPNVSFYPNDVGTGITGQHTQPWLGEIEFDRQADGSYGMIIAERNRYHDVINSSFYVAGGVMFRACGTENNWMLENFGVCDDYVSAVNWSFTGTAAGVYTDSLNRFFKYVGREGTMGAGTMTMYPGGTDVIMPVMDNLFNSATSGVTWIRTIDGERSKDIRILGNYAAGGFDATNFTKANNWGAIASMCTPPDIQIGNYVFEDVNDDGEQDACDLPIRGVHVSLYDKQGNFLATTTTDENGEYYFTNGVDTTIVADSSYFLVFGTNGTDTQFANDELTAGLKVFEVAQDSTVASDIDSDIDQTDRTMALGDIPAGFPYTCVTPSMTDHTYDAGFTLLRTTCPMIDEPNDTVICNSLVYTLPPITGMDLTGEEAYYTEMNGCGERYEAGQAFNFNGDTTLYLYDAAVTHPQGTAATLEGQYTFEQTLDDVSGNGRNKVVGTDPTYNTDAQEGTYSADYNGTNQYTDYDINAGYLNEAFSQRTISMWIKPDDLSGEQILFEQGNQANGLALRLNNAVLEAGVAEANVRFTATGSKDFRLDGEWHHVAAVFDNGELRVYLDGVGGTAVTTSYTMVSASAANSGGGIGRSISTNAFNSGNNNIYYGGLIDDLRIIGAAEPPILECSDEKDLAITRQSIEVTPTVVCNGVNDFDLNVQVDWLGVDFASETILVDAGGQMMTITPTAASGTETIMFSFTAPAYNLLVAANLSITTDCSTSTIIDLVPDETCAPPCTSTLGGNVFNDYDNDGIDDGMDEIGQGNILVEIYECNAMMPTLTTYTNVNGDWSVDDTGLMYPVRVEFSTALTPNLSASTQGSGNGTNVQFIDISSCEVNFGVINDA
ncbi:MAG: SdrD B-like domain-containing protein, partial [Bacteroidota bacterium]